jgi:trigger factor
MDERHRFEAPPSLVEQEFAGIWNSVTEEMKSQNRTFADEDTTEEKAREEYRRIADRRVRLGLVLAEVGDKNSITVSEDELMRALVERARQYRGQEQQAFEQMRKNPQVMAAVRAPLFEEKVVDFLLELAKVKDKPVSREALYSDDDEHVHHHDHDHHDHDHHHHHHHGEGDAPKKSGKKSGGKGKKA